MPTHPLFGKLGLPSLRHLNLEGLSELLIGVGYGLIREPQMPQNSLNCGRHVEDLHQLDPDVQTLIEDLPCYPQLSFCQRIGNKRHLFTILLRDLHQCGVVTSLVKVSWFVDQTIRFDVVRVIGRVSVAGRHALIMPSVMGLRLFSCGPAVQTMRAACQVLGVLPTKLR